MVVICGIADNVMSKAAMTVATLSIARARPARRWSTAPAMLAMPAATDLARLQRAVSGGSLRPRALAALTELCLAVEPAPSPPPARGLAPFDQTGCRSAAAPVLGRRGG